MDCDKLIQNINPCATTSPFRMWDEVGYIVPYADIKNIVFNGMTVNFDTIGTAFSVRDRRLNPFSGSGSEFVRGDMGSVSWTERVNFPALANSVENATIANAIANGGRVVVILKQLDYESDGKGKYQVFGIDGGLRIDSEPFDAYADAAWNITLIAEKMSRPAVYLWDTDEATTDAKWELITQYEVITGLSIASGTVTPQQVTLFTNSTPSSYIILPDGSKLTTDGSGEINTTWAGASGDIVIVIPKGNQIAFSDGGMSPADFIGQLVSNTSETIQIDGCVNITSAIAHLATSFTSAGCTSLASISAPNATVFDCSSCPSLTSVSAPNATVFDCSSCPSLTSVSAPNATAFYCVDSTSLTSVSAPNATTIDASGCALTAVAIEAQLAATVANISDLSTVSIDFSGGTSAAYSTWPAQAQADAQTIITAGGTVTYTA